MHICNIVLVYTLHATQSHIGIRYTITNSGIKHFYFTHTHTLKQTQAARVHVNKCTPHCVGLLLSLLLLVQKKIVVENIELRKNENTSHIRKLLPRRRTHTLFNIMLSIFDYTQYPVCVSMYNSIACVAHKPDYGRIHQHMV